ncbi:hypothetical protein ACVMB0_000034 [Bradyrhizobium sp. USDA 4451]
MKRRPQQSPIARTLHATIPGIGILGATAVLAAIGKGLEIPERLPKRNGYCDWIQETRADTIELRAPEPAQRLLRFQPRIPHWKLRSPPSCRQVMCRAPADDLRHDLLRDLLRICRLNHVQTNWKNMRAHPCDPTTPHRWYSNFACRRFQQPTAIRSVLRILTEPSIPAYVSSSLDRRAPLHRSRGHYGF